MNTFLSFWYLQSPAWTLASFQRSIRTFESTIGVVDMVRNIRKPLFQDYTVQGRAIGMAIRLVRILVGVLFYALTASVYGLTYLFWLLFPAICLTCLLGSFLGPFPNAAEL